MVTFGDIREIAVILWKLQLTFNILLRKAFPFYFTIPCFLVNKEMVKKWMVEKSYRLFVANIIQCISVQST